MKIRSKENKPPIPFPVYLLGLVSLFNDIASEMLYPILPIFLTQVLHAPVFIVGIIDGVAEGTSSIFKTVFGYFSDKLQKRKVFVVAGYGASAVSKIIIALSSTWPLVFLGRFIDRLGKGVRTSSRDALLLENTSEKNKGLIFGVHRSFDSAGAFFGPIISLLLLQLFNNDLRKILYIAAIPSFIGLLFFFLIKDTKKRSQISKIKLSQLLSFKNLSPQFKIFLITLAIFSLGNSSDSFLILRSKQIGLSLSLVILAYIVYNLVYTLLSTPAGILADKLGAKKIFALGLLIYIGVYLGFALNTHPYFVWVLFAVYGAYIALTDGVSKALIGSYITTETAGTYYGISQTVMSISTLLASVIGGFLWTLVSPTATFMFAAGCATLALVIFFTTRSLK